MGPSGTITLITTVLVLVFYIQVAGAATYDGRPRPRHFPDIPTAAYGKLPTVYNDGGFAVECDWYGWANVKYSASITDQCLTYLWTVSILPEAGRNTLDPYYYYDCSDEVCWDRAVTNDEYCIIGCFYLNGTAGLPPITSPPPVSTAPPTPDAPGNQSPNTNQRVISGAGAIQHPTALVWCAVAGVGAAALILNQFGAS